MHDRDRILGAVDLAALADELLGARRGTTRSGTWRCPSTEHAQTGRTPPVTVFRTGRGEQRWHCHGCGLGGTAIDLVMATTGRRVRDAMEYLAHRSGVPEPVAPHRARSAAARPSSPPLRVSDPEGLAAFVDQCAERLWDREGRPVRRWLTEVRGIPEAVLRVNGIGADPGARSQSRPLGMPSAGLAAVLPVREGDTPVFAQLRVLDPVDGAPRYLNASSRLAANPRVAHYRPERQRSDVRVLTEGVVDALSAAAAGFRAAAVLGATVSHLGHRAPTFGTTSSIARSDPVVVAFDNDAAGDAGARRWIEQLRTEGSRPRKLHVPAGLNDLNEWMRASPGWEQVLGEATDAAREPARQVRGRSSVAL